jgi:mannose-6-phosphate isomerase-like protein (cupin superfamily)
MACGKEKLQRAIAMKKRKAIFLSPGEGRAYPMGRILSVFKADGAETDNEYSISEWWMEPNTKGPPLHDHEDDHAWYVLEGTMSICVGPKWVDAPKGSFVLIPGKTPHTFENRSSSRAGILSFNDDAGFEDQMPGISQYFAAHPAGDAIPAKRAVK